MRDKILNYVSPNYFYGWIIVAVANLGIFSSGPGQSHTFSVFVGPIGKDLDLSSTSIASAYGLATLIAAFMLPYMGKLIDKYGARKTLIIVSIILGFSCVFFGAASNFLMLTVGFGFLRFFGQGSLMLGCANLVSQWFDKKRGFAMSLMALGFGISMAIHPPLSQFLIDEYGWKFAWVFLGVSTWIIMVPTLYILAWNTPESVGLLPDGDKRAESINDKNEPIEGLDLTQALKEKSFYILSAMWFGMAMLVTTLHFYQVTILTSQGISTDFAANLFTVSAIAMVLFMPVVGKLFDNIPTNFVLTIGLIINCISLLSITYANNEYYAFFYAIFFGINNAISMTMFGYIWPRYFGRKHLGSIQGTGQMIGVIGASLGPLPVGFAIDYIGDSLVTIRYLALYPLIISFLTIFFLKPPPSLTKK
ncbi:MFS transporter [Alphaproteobacteria bacterium]|jgi:MFS family permease|nr:MFS transporter [Alphaproteobacteria bacterium]MDA8687671.1 MFS transporter [bacterium]MDA9164815.1 MFS transporter [Alphaproteobacteria bacterium]MDA9807464.1 MFS transporter [Alphaproteobacteria bacterium]MDA9914235.1 MFS transporter [Alphaproteobacteria bacterium]